MVLLEFVEKGEKAVVKKAKKSAVKKDTKKGVRSILKKTVGKQSGPKVKAVSQKQTVTRQKKG